MNGWRGVESGAARFFGSAVLRVTRGHGQGGWVPACARTTGGGKGAHEGLVRPEPRNDRGRRMVRGGVGWGKGAHEGRTGEGLSVGGGNGAQ